MTFFTTDPLNQHEIADIERCLNRGEVIPRMLIRLLIITIRAHEARSGPLEAIPTPVERGEVPLFK